MKRKLLSIICLVLCFTTLFAACKKNNTVSSTGSTRPLTELQKNHGEETPFAVPENLMTVEQYHTEIQNLLKGKNFTDATDEYLANIDKLGDGLCDSIIYSTNDTTECTGTKYYISNNGNDANDGTSPEKAWATLKKLKSSPVKAGDLVLLERGSMWRESLPCVSGVTYSAYGEGYKPKLWKSLDGLQFDWVETETPNVWKYDPQDKRIVDVGAVVYNYGESYGQQEKTMENLQQQGDFIFLGTVPDIENIKRDYCLYIYSEGNPQEYYQAIDISFGNSVLEMAHGSHDITINNLEMLYGQDYYFIDNPKNIVITDCVFGWQGGQTNGKGNRYGGGGGAWVSCDNLVFDHCYFYQQFDCAVTPQFDAAGGGTVSVFNNFIVKNCLIETSEYGLEYFNTQKNTDDNKISNMYLGYNFFRYMGDGFGNKPAQSACVKSWEHENTTYDSVIEYNIFDRPFSLSLEITGKKQEDGKATYDNSLIPTIRNNIYISIKGRKFNRVNGVDYKFTEESYNKLKDAGIETGALYVFAKKN